IAGIHRRMSIGDPDDRFVEITVAEAHCAQHGAIRRTSDALGDDPATAIERHGGLASVPAYNRLILAKRLTSIPASCHTRWYIPNSIRSRFSSVHSRCAGMGSCTWWDSYFSLCLGSIARGRIF